MLWAKRQQALELAGPIEQKHRQASTSPADVDGGSCIRSRTMTAFFQETQRPPVQVMAVLAVAGLVAAGWGIWLSVRLGHFVWRPFLGPAVALLAIAMLRMTTTVEAQHIRVVVFPFPRKTFRFGDIDRAEPVTYRPLLHYGGWGWRWGKGGMAYTMRGNRGVRIHLRNGKTVLVGSQRPEELVAAIEAARQGRPSGA